MRHRVVRVLRYLFIAALLGELGYIVSANAFLNCGGMHKVLEGTDQVRVTTGPSWTLWPGRIHVKDLRILFHDYNFEWSLDAKSIQLELAFLPFLSKTFHATRVRGDGVVFRMRHLVDAADTVMPSTLALPPIPEFGPPGIFHEYTPPPPRTDLWRIHIEDVDVQVVELWAQQFRYVGSGRARGAFRLHAGFHVWVGPASLDLDPSELLAGNRLLTPRFGGHIDCVVHPMFVDPIHGLEFLRYVTATVNVHGEDMRLAPLDMFLQVGTTLSAPGARLEIAAATDHGVITPTSRVALRGPELDGRRGDWAYHSRAFELGAHGSADGTGEATLFLVQGIVSRADHPNTGLSIAYGNLAVANTTLDTTATWKLSRLDGGFSNLEIPMLSGFDDLTRAHGVRLDGGSVKADASGRYEGGLLSGEARASVSKAAGRAQALGWQVDGNLQLSLGRMQTEGLAGAATDGSLDFGFQGHQLALSTSSTRIEALEAEVTAHARRSDALTTGQMQATAGQLSFRRAALRIASRADISVHLSKLDIGRAAAHASVSAELSAIELRNGTTARGRARIARVSSELSLQESVLSQGRLTISVPALSLRTGSTAWAAHARLDVNAKDLDVQHKRGRAASLLLLKNVSAVDATKGAKCQWASVPRTAILATLGFLPDGHASVGVSGGIQGARGRWKDLEVSGDARFGTRYLERISSLIAVQVDATKLRLKKGASETEGWDANIAALRVAGKLDLNLGQLSGPVKIRAQHVVGRIGKTPMHADLSSELNLSKVDLTDGVAVGSAALRIDHAGVTAGKVRVEDWWARVEIPMVRVGADSIDVIGEFRAKLRDGLPALVMFAASGDVPGWVPKMLPLQNLEAHGQFRTSCRNTDIVFENASGGPLVAAGRIQSVPGDTRAAFLVQWHSPLRVSAGLTAYGDKVSVALLAGNDWLRTQGGILDSYEQSASCVPAPDSCQEVSEAGGARHALDALLIDSAVR